MNKSRTNNSAEQIQATLFLFPMKSWVFYEAQSFIPGSNVKQYAQAVLTVYKTVLVHPINFMSALQEGTSFEGGDLLNLRKTWQIAKYSIYL